jgi:UDP-N-acetylmuramoyl-tripeptide--D-alanyl-D-alanine ligase
LLDYRPTAEGGAVRASVAGRALDYALCLHGRHWALNSLAVLGAVHALDGDVAAAAAALDQLTALKGRGARRTLRWDGGTVALIDESYNASPASMRAAIAVLGAAETGAGGRRVAVLGDMLELGDDAERLHEDLAPALAEAGIDLVFAVGPCMARLFRAVPESRRGGHADTSDAIIEELTAALRAGDVVMVKGSLGSRMGAVVAALGEGRDAL